MGERRKLPFFRSKSIWVKMNAEDYVNFCLLSQDFFWRMQKHFAENLVF
jgi:hypothetical protein